MQRVYVRSGDGLFDVMVDKQIAAQVGWVDLCNAIIEVTSILRHGRGEVSLRVADKVIDMSFVEALDFVMQATSSLRW